MSISKTIKEYFLMILGTFIAAVALAVFLVPYKIAPGGVSGLATAIYYATGKVIPVGVTIVAVNIPLFVLAIYVLGYRFCLKSIISTVLFSTFIDVMEPFVVNNITDSILLSPDKAMAMPDIFMYTILGGVLLGAGMGLVFKAGSTTGGSDMLAKIILKFKPAFTMGQLILIIDIFVITISAVIFASINSALYSAVALFLSTKVIDAVLSGIAYVRAVFVISEKADRIGEMVVSEIKRGATLIEGQGMYSKKNKNVLVCIVNKNQIQQLKKIVEKVDDTAFTIMTDVREVMGEGF